MLHLLMPIPRHEQETTVTRLHSEAEAHLFTSNPATHAKWLRLGYLTKVFGAKDGVPHSWEATVPARCVSFRGLTKARRIPPKVI